MKNAFAFLILVLATTFAASGQTAAEPKATGNVWLEVMAGPNGAVLYPQYNWSAPISGGTFSGYGFVESAPHEELFSNNLVGFTPKAAPWFTAHGELGGLPGHAKGFAQLGPRINLEKAVPGLNKVIAFAFVAYLPAMTGIRTNNILFAGATRQFPVVGKTFTFRVEAFDRTFATFSYSEVWLVGHAHAWQHVEPVVHMIRDSSRNPTYTVEAGFRFSFK